MKMSNLVKTIVIGLALLCAIPQDGHAQKRYAAFIHGFYFGDDRGVELKDKGRYMKTSGTPAQWNNSRAIDGRIFLRYYDRDLYGTGSTEDNTRRDMMERFVEKMKNKGSSAEWILVGHSQGGIVARLLHEHIRKNEPGLDVEGVLAIASPMQGAKPAAVSYGQRSGYKNIKPIVDGFVDDLLSPLDIGPIETSDFAAFAANEALERINSLAANKKANQAIGPDGDLIQKINSARNPDAYRALLGAERAPVPFRILSGSPIEEEAGQVFGKRWEPLFVTDLHKSYIDYLGINIDENMKPGNEPKTVKLKNKILSEIKEREDEAENVTRCLFGVLFCNTDYNKRQWRTTRRTFENIGRTHTKVLDAYRLDRRKKRYECDYWYDSRKSQSRRGGNAKFSPPSIREHISRDWQYDCRRVDKTYYVTVPNKTDGLLGTNTTTWNPPEKGEGPNLGPHSKLYSDELSARNDGNPHTKGGTGYHHAEMMYAKRRYSSSADPGIADDEFDEGDPNPPIQEGEDFLKRTVFR